MGTHRPQNLCPDPHRPADILSGRKPHVMVRKLQQKSTTSRQRAWRSRQCGTMSRLEFFRSMVTISKQLSTRQMIQTSLLVAGTVPRLGSPWQVSFFVIVKLSRWPETSRQVSGKQMWFYVNVCFGKDFHYWTNRMRTLTQEELGTYSCSHSRKFNHSASFLLTRYNHIQNIPILEVRNGRIKQKSNGGRGEMQNIQISISFHTQPITMKTQSICRLKNSKQGGI